MIIPQNQKTMSKINHAKVKFLILSVLEEQKDKTLTQGKITDLVAQKLGLNEQKLAEHYARESDKKFYKMIATNEQRLQAAGLEVFLKNGHKITNNGHKALEDNKKSEEITYEYLRTIPEYNEWEKRLGISPKDCKKIKEIIEDDSVFVAPTRIKSCQPKNDIDQSFDEPELKNAIERIKYNFKRFEWYYRLYEENVRAEMIEPILKVLGWTAPFVRREERNMDYLLSDEKYINKKGNKLVIEVKKYQEQLYSCGEKMELMNESQLQEYCRQEFPLAGILTNGIRWCLYAGNGYEYKGEIDIRNTEIEDCIRFFKAISIKEFSMINEFDWNWLTLSIKERDIHPTKIIIEGEDTNCKPSEVYCKVAERFIDKCIESGTNPLDYQFNKVVVSSGKINDQCYKYKGYMINKKYGIYDIITLVQTMNATLDLPFELRIE
jgi:hypothetical protein